MSKYTYQELVKTAEYLRNEIEYLKNDITHISPNNLIPKTILNEIKTSNIKIQKSIKDLEKRKEKINSIINKWIDEL